MKDRWRQGLIIASFGLAGWALCGASIAVGFAVTTEAGALILHAVAAPIIFVTISWIYFKRFAFTGPLVTAALFVAVVIALDVVVVAMLIEQSFDMFGSAIGTWIPFALIFLATCATGTIFERR